MYILHPFFLLENNYLPFSFVQKIPSFTIRTINYINIKRGRASTLYPFVYKDNFDYWDISFNAQSFLYRQIRRMVGALVAVAKGNINQSDLYEMLTVPSQHSFCNKITIAPSHGLYLADIEFREKCLLKC